MYRKIVLIFNFLHCMAPEYLNVIKFVREVSTRNTRRVVRTIILSTLQRPRLSTVNELLFAATLFRDSSVINCSRLVNFAIKLFSFIWNYIIHLVRDEKYSRHQSSRELFSLANKSWFTVFQKVVFHFISDSIVLSTRFY
jgi:hypothetical protein